MARLVLFAVMLLAIALTGAAADGEQQQQAVSAGMKGRKLLGWYQPKAVADESDSASSSGPGGSSSGQSSQTATTASPDETKSTAIGSSTAEGKGKPSTAQTYGKGKTYAQSGGYKGWAKAENGAGSGSLPSKDVKANSAHKAETTINKDGVVAFSTGNSGASAKYGSVYGFGNGDTGAKSKHGYSKADSGVGAYSVGKKPSVSTAFQADSKEFSNGGRQAFVNGDSNATAKYGKVGTKGEGTVVAGNDKGDGGAAATRTDGYADGENPASRSQHSATVNQNADGTGNSNADGVSKSSSDKGTAYTDGHGQSEYTYNGQTAGSSVDVQAKATGDNAKSQSNYGSFTTTNDDGSVTSSSSGVGQASSDSGSSSTSSHSSSSSSP